MKLKLKTVIEEYFYDSREQRDEHIKVMEQNGWENTGQVRYDVNKSLENPDYRWYGQFIKYSK